MGFETSPLSNGILLLALTVVLWRDVKLESIYFVGMETCMHRPLLEKLGED